MECNVPATTRKEEHTVSCEMQIDTEQDDRKDTLRKDTPNNMQTDAIDGTDGSDVTPLPPLILQI